MQDFPNYDGLLEHSASLHSSTTCASCKKNFWTENGLKKHLFDSPKHPNCKSCRMGFRDRDSYAAHKADVHGNIGKRKRPLSSVVTASPCSSFIQNELLRRSSSPASSSSQSSLVEGKSSRGSSPLNMDLRTKTSVTTVSEEARCTPTRSAFTRQIPESSPQVYPRVQDMTEAGKSQESPTESTFSRHFANFSSPLLEATVPLPSDGSSEISADEDRDRARSTQTSPLRLSQESTFRRSRTDTEPRDSEDARGRPADPSGGSMRRTTMLSDSLRATWRAKCKAASNPSLLPWESPSSTLLTSYQLSKFPTAPHDSESELCRPSGTDSSPAYVPLQRPSGLRKRRLSLSPTLPSIPEATNSVVSPVEPNDSDTESSLGIFEHQAEDFLYDNLSERCPTPMTYLSAGEFEEDERGNDYESYSDGTCPSPPPLIMEDLTQLAREMCSSPLDDDPFADPFDLHPSCGNSPMDARFSAQISGRPRAWSIGLSDPVSDPIEPLESSFKFEKLKRLTDTSAEEVFEDVPVVNEHDHAVIEDDLFSEQEEEMVRSPVAARFVEEDHPLRGLISLESTKAITRQSSSGPLSPPPSPGQEMVYVESVEALLEDTEPHTPGLKLHCRLCQSDPCQDVTATFCGHIFCFECIAEEVTANSRCPVCNAPTLLYCLFKLDLSS
ncbi:hypothetical protein DFH11DRAFT_1606432 [Phellopilus nigrolimitatus]|nr:hypothetical protein DFH11DRAFT_1606432 [Phellopilus nigrolimitatus]